MTTLALSKVPGFADVPSSALQAERPVIGAQLARINGNAAFGMCRLEVFVAIYKNGDTVGLPTSAVDGYTYARNELTYVWGISSSVNPDTGWVSGPDSLWYCAWLVDQATGNVNTIEWYRRSGDHDNASQSNDGSLIVYTIAQRQQSTLLISEQMVAYTDVSLALLVTDAALTQAIFQGLNTNAKFGAVNGEIIYMGEFVNGGTVPRAVSPADGYQYTRAETKLISSWRWTTVGSAFNEPDKSRGQLGPILCSINQSTGVVSTTINYIPDENTVTPYTDGRVAVFAVCSRSDLIDTIPALANNFAEIDDSVFFPGETLRASTLVQVDKNIREAAASPEFFGPTLYKHGDTVALPTSALDGYAYTRDECYYLWDWADTTMETGTHLRMPLFDCNVAFSGAVTLEVWRLPPGGPYVMGDLTKPRINVVTVAIRGATHTLPVQGGGTGGSGGGIDINPPETNPYAIGVDIGEKTKPLSLQSLVRHVIAGELTSVIFPSGAAPSYLRARVAATSTYVITIKQYVAGVPTTIGTATFAAAASVATFSFSANITRVPGDEIELVGQVTPDATLAGIYGNFVGTRQ